MNFITNVWLYIRPRPLIWIAIVVVALGGAWITFGSQRGNEQTLVVAKAPFEATISVSGKVVSAHDVELGFSQGGRISHVYAKVGKTVKAGTLLAEVENGDLYAGVLEKQAKLMALKEGTRPEEIAVKATAVDNAHATLFASIQDAYRASDAAIHNTADQLFSNPRMMPILNFRTNNSQAAIDVTTARLAIDPILSDWKQDIESGTSDIATLTFNSQENLARVSDFLAKCNNALNDATTNASFTSSVIEGYLSDVATARSAVNTAINTVVANNAARLTAEKNFDLARAPSRATDIEAAQADVMNAQALLTKTRIVAPFDGIVTRIDIEQGEIAQASTPVVVLIGGAFQIEAYVPEVEIAALKPTDTASVYLDAYGKGAPFSAAIISIDPAETIKEGISTYKTTFQFTGSDERIRSGMTANILITTERKENVIVIPIGAIVWNEGASFVKVKEDGDIVERSVTLGTSNLGQTEVLTGLEEGDVLVLNP